MAGREEIFKKVMNTGHSAAWDQQWDKAAAAYQKALDEFPDHPQALVNLGLALFELQRYDESLLFYQRATQVSSNDPVPFEKVGQLSGRAGDIKAAIQAYMKAAELYIKSQDAQKAVQQWVNVIQLDVEHIPAHSYLAMVHERLGHAPQAINEYLATASLLQSSGNADKAAEMIGRALHLDPENAESRRAQSMLKNGQPLPKPLRPQGGTGPLLMAQLKQLDAPKNNDTGLDPIAEARQKALTRLAEILFELSEEGGDMPSTRRSSMQNIVKGTGPLDFKQAERSRVMLYISQAIDALTKEQDAQAITELTKAVQAGLKSSAAQFLIGFLLVKAEKNEEGLQALQNAVKHEGYALGTRLLMGQTLRRMDKLPEALTEYLEALKTADTAVVPAEKTTELRGMYEPIIEAQKRVSDPTEQEQLFNNIHQMLMQPNWRTQVTQAREQLPESVDGMPPIPLAEMIAQTRSSEVIDSIGKVRALARDGHLRTAMEEAFEALKHAPTYLPLHSLIGDLLLQEGRSQDAINKYSVVAQAYSSRGEVSQAVDLLRRIIKASPMDLGARTRLIEQLAARGSVNEAIVEYLDLAEIHYRLAELDAARKTYATALHLAQQGGASRSWSVKLLQRMADIDVQMLDWRQALRVYEQIRTLQPDDAQLRKNLINLNLRLGEYQQAAAELENYLDYLQSSGHRADAIPFLEELVNEEPGQGMFRHVLANEYRQARRIPEAVAQLDALGTLLLDAGERNRAIQAIEAIVAMNPPNVSDYAILLSRLKAEG